MEKRTIKRALISVYHKDGIDKIATLLNNQNIEIVSTGGTYDYIKNLNIAVTPVEDITSYPSILGGRVKTLHPKIFGGILTRRDNNDDISHGKQYNIDNIDLVIVDLYPFEEYVQQGYSHSEIIEKIDIGGISLIRAAAKNFNDVLIISEKRQYPQLIEILESQNGETTINQRASFAALAFEVSSHYDSAIYNYLSSDQKDSFKLSVKTRQELRYGENPHQKASYYGDPNSLPKQIHGKEISYNNLLDIEAAIELISDFKDTTVAILKHNNACGCASADSVEQAWELALSADPISAFGGVIIANREIDANAATQIDKIFFEVVIAPSYSPEALEILKSKKNRIILISNLKNRSPYKFRSMLGGVLVQDCDNYSETIEDLTYCTNKRPSNKEVEDLIFANILVKHSKSNAIVLAKDKRLIASGIGQTSRVDALKQAIEKANHFNIPLEGSVMASDAFFPFPDCVEIAHKEGITAVIQPGGSIKDQLSIDFCNSSDISMVMTGKRHFKH